MQQQEQQVNDVGDGITAALVLLVTIAT